MLTYHGPSRLSGFQGLNDRAAHGQGELMHYQNDTDSTKNEFEAVSTASRGLNMKQVAETERQLKQSQQLLASVSNDLGGVKTDLKGAKGDIEATRGDLEATKKRLETTIGDLGMQSGLIAHTRDELEVLMHKGDRN